MKCRSNGKSNKKLEELMRSYVFESISVDGYFNDVNDDMSWAHNGKPDAEFGGW